MTTKKGVCGILIKSLCVAALVVLWVGSASAADGKSTEGAVGPDVVVFDLYGTEYWGSSNDSSAYSVATESCNRGDVPVEWVSGTNEHPVIAQNLYRLKEGRFEQLGQSWLKHGFLSINGSACDTCIQPPNGGAQLGVGCSDPYSAGLNGSQGLLGPRSEVNAFTGEFPMPHSLPDGGAYTVLSGRIQVATDDVTPAMNTGALYFIEGQYVTQDDAGADNGLNNAAYRKVNVAANLDLTLDGATQESVPAIFAWNAEEPTVTVRKVDVPSEGSFYIAHKATDNGNGTWRYEYALFNLNSHRSAWSFAVPIEGDTVITNAGFRDVDSHSGEPYDPTDWTITVDNGAGWISWSTDDFATNEDANALRWGTMYNFWFDADASPQTGGAQIGLFRPGSPSSLEPMVLAPRAGGSFIFADGFENGDTAAW
ncbi:MAG: hypothetical protein KAJ78_02675 [Acidobacteria bacterium]|nr:hypothetical protein [Acidobacteriota bacterium]